MSAEAVGFQERLRGAVAALLPRPEDGALDECDLSRLLQCVDPAAWDEEKAKIVAKGLAKDEHGRIPYNAFVDWLCAPPCGSTGSGVAPEAQVALALATGSAKPGPCIVDTVSEDTEIEYLTDVEGNWDYFVRFVWQSKVLHFDCDGPDSGVWGPGTIRLADNGIFVFGGDATDKGPGDIRFVRTLLDLKERYPDRVFIILGNRDMSKLRFYSELQEGGEDNPFKPWWPVSKTQYTDYLEKEGKQKDLLSLLQFMLHCNMGCQHTTFKTRKSELALLYRKADDQDVLKSFRGSVDPEGCDPWMLNLCRAGHLAVVLGDTLFVHGSLYDACLGRVPEREEPVEGLREWVIALNAWKESQLRDFEKRGRWREEGGQRVRGGQALIEYGVPKGANGTTIVYYNPFKDGNPQPVSMKVEEYLQKNGIRRLCSGHQPHGQTPTVVRHPHTGLLRLTCDTSFSDPKADKVFNPANNRGVAVSVTRLRGPYVFIQGVMRDSRQHGYQLHVRPDEDTFPDALVGRQLTNGAWIKTLLRHGPGEVQVITALAVGFDINIEEMHPARACIMLQKEHSTLPCLGVNFQELFGSSLCSLTSFEKHMDRDESLEGCEEACQPSLQFNPEEFKAQETFIFRTMGVIHNIRDDDKQTQSVEELQMKVRDKINELIDLGKRVIFLSHDSNYSRRSLAKELVGMGYKLPKEPDDWGPTTAKFVVTTAFTCAWFLKRCGIRKPFVICSSRGLLDELREEGITEYVATVDEDGNPLKEYLETASRSNVTKLLSAMSEKGRVDAVVVGWDLHFTPLKVAVAASLLKFSLWKGEQIKLVSCAPDETEMLGLTPKNFMNDFGEETIPAMGNGAMAKAICRSVGHSEVQPLVVGLPSEIMLETLRRPEDEFGYNVDCSKAVMIGTQMKPDIEFAVHSGMKSLLLLYGVSEYLDTAGKPMSPSKRPARLKSINEWRLGSTANNLSQLIEENAGCPTWIAENFGDAEEDAVAWRESHG